MRDPPQFTADTWRQMTASTPPEEFDTIAGESFPDIYAHMKQLAAAFLQNSISGSDKTPSSILNEAWVRAAKTSKDVQKTEAVDERLSLANALYCVLRDHAQQMRKAGRAIACRRWPFGFSFALRHHSSSGKLDCRGL